LRTGCGWTQEDLAELLGVDRKTINRLENGTFSLSLDRVFQLAVAFNVEPAALFSR
jgi:transcriptional regulator with XRE-family HTH domain